MKEWWSYLATKLYQTVSELVQLDLQLIILVFLLVLFAILTDSILARIQTVRRSTGVTRRMEIKAVDGGYFKTTREYISSNQLLAGRPDAIVKEHGFVIPIERKSSNSKPRNKDIAQILVYCRLIEEFEKIRPPYGYLIMGDKAKRYKIINSVERQAWLDQQIIKLHFNKHC